MSQPDAREEDLSLELVRRIQGGDRAAWERLYLRYHDPLLLAIRCRLGARLRARLQSEDVLQSVVKDALVDLARFEPRGPGSLSHYLHACVLNKIRAKAEYHGAQKRGGEAQLAPAALDELSGEEHEPTYFDEERFGRLERGVRLLPENLREVVVLRSLEGLSNREAAEVLGRTPEAVSKLYNRALARLATLVGPEERV